jgi:uncharacterized membrane protein YtjA (UPF0391 family)
MHLTPRGAEHIACAAWKNHRISISVMSSAQRLPLNGNAWPASSDGQGVMLEFAYFFFALAVIAALLGFLGLVGLAALTAKALCLAFLALFLIATFRGHPHR